jgi:16S rRNA (cytosine967-C5)-methyltransferase
MIRAFAVGKPGPDLRAHLRLGLAQIFFLGSVPARAAVSEQVRAVTDSLGPSKAPYANAVLRTALRASEEGICGDPRRDLVGTEMHFKEPLFADPDQHPLLWFEEALSLPAALAKGWIKRYGRERAEALARDCLADPRLSLSCVNTERELVQAELAALDMECTAAEHPAILCSGPEALSAVLKSPAFREGRITIQGEAARRAAELCGAREGERWLDLCAAPGGKTCVLAAAGAQVTACDVSEEKIARLQETCTRLGLEQRVEAIALEGIAREGAAPASDPPEDSTLPGEELPRGLFDGVLLDVPCSNTGVLARRPEARWRWGPASRASLQDLQQQLLERGAKKVRPGGRLVYSTCSLEPDENRQRVRWFLSSHPGWVLEEELETLPAPAAPAGPVDGGYVARLVQRR